MKRILTKMKGLTRILLVGETEASSAEVQLARDNQLKATNCRWGVAVIHLPSPVCACLCVSAGRHLTTWTIQSFVMPKKNLLAKGKESLLIMKWICPIHAEPIQ